MRMVRPIIISIDKSWFCHSSSLSTSRFFPFLKNTLLKFAHKRLQYHKTTIGYQVLVDVLTQFLVALSCY